MIKKLILFISVFVLGSQMTMASLKVRVSGATSVYKDAAATSCSNWGAAWYRKICFEQLKAGNVDGMTEFYVDSVNESFVGRISFVHNDASGNAPTEQFLLSGVTDEFKVPSTGEYEFRIRSNSYMFVYIDDALIGAGNDVWMANDFVNPNRPVDAAGSYPFVLPEHKSKEYGVTKDYTGSKTLESGKNHKFEIRYSHHSALSVASVYWRKKGETDFKPIPASAFGQRKQYGTPLVFWVKPEPSGSIEGLGQVKVDFEVRAENNPNNLPVSFLWDFDGDGTIDKEGPETSASYTFTNNTTPFLIIGPIVQSKIGEALSPPTKGPNIFLAQGPATAINTSPKGFTEKSNSVLHFDASGRIQTKGSNPRSASKMIFR